MSDQRITVAVRIRPPLAKERYEPLCARKADDDQTIMIKPEENAANMGETVSFQFDTVFDENDYQQDVYEESVQELVDHALSGFNATVFTYGQTGSGKTFTILGAVSSDGAVNAESGMFLRVFNDLFNYKATVRNKIHMIITLSALELYVDDVMDLLANKNKLKLRETPEETLTMGIRTVEVTTMAEVTANFEIANSFRSVTATKMNNVSSRSHALFFIDILQFPVEKCPSAPPLDAIVDSNGSPVSSAPPGLVRSRIALVDLAGSERVKRSGVTGQGMTEAQAINKSLSTLGTVINAMYVQSPHIPFRESKLTKLLKTSFMDTTSRLLLIGQVAPPTNSAQESLSTLRFCDRVKGLKAGQVMGFSDPAEEERFLHSLRLNEELTAEMRILNAQYYFQPVNLRVLAALKGTSAAAEQQRVVQELQAGAATLFEAKERALQEQMEREAAQERDGEVEKFVLHMNELIEEYEVVATAAKKEKKALKKLSEETEAEQEAKLHEAKKAKKNRLKLEERNAQLTQELEAAAAQEQQLADAIPAVQSGTSDFDTPEKEAAAGEQGVGNGTSSSPLTPEMEQATHRLVESFFGNCLDMNRLYSQYVIRLNQTERQRAQVRRQKLLSSTLVTDGTLLYDILAFLVDRAVDVAEGDVPLQARWFWHDVDGLSSQLLNAEQIFPPLLEYKEENHLNQRLAAGRRPCKEEYHNNTFISSDDSDSENSHHAAESRRQRKIKIRNGLQTEVSSSEEEEPEGDDSGLGRRKNGDGGSSASDGDDRCETEDGESTPIPKSTNWLNGGLEREDEGGAEGAGNAHAAAAAVQDGQQEEGVGHSGEKKHRKKHHRKPAEGEEEGEGDATAGGRIAANGGVGGESQEESPADASLGTGKDDGDEGEEGRKRRKKDKKHRKSAAEIHAAEEEEDEEVGAAKEAGDEAATGEGDHGKDRREGENDEAGAERQKKTSKEAAANESRADSTADEVARSLDFGPNGEPLPRPKQLSQDEIDHLYVMKVYDSPRLVQELLKFLRSGAVMLKHGRKGKPHNRLFWINITKGKRELLWREPESKRAEPSAISLEEVSYIQLGAYGKVFKRNPIYPHDPSFFRSFTVGLKGGGRTVDVVAKSTADYEAWIVGLSHIVAVDPAWGGKLDVTKEAGYERLNYFESILCEQNYIYPSNYLTLKKAVQNVAMRTIDALQSNGNDLKKAFSVIGGIHLPGINEKGAVYLTKGELRYLCPELKLDIFRVTHVWLYFQQINLVYDDNFVLATPFGVTRRE